VRCRRFDSGPWHHKNRVRRRLFGAGTIRTPAAIGPNGLQARPGAADKLVGMSERVFRLAATLVAAAALIGLIPLRAPAAIQVGSDVSGAPFEYFGPGHRMLGFDIDLLQAMSAQLGPVLVVNHSFDDLLAAVKRGKFDLAMSAISDTRDREKIVDFVDYFVAGGGIMVRAGNPHRIFAIDALCGYGVTIETGTSYLADLQKQSDDCKAVGLAPIDLITSPTDDAAFAAFQAGKGDAYIADYPVAVYRQKYLKGGSAFEVVPRQFHVVPYGIAVAKENSKMKIAVQSALLGAIADGTYDRLLKKWNLEAGALRSAPVNAGTLFEK
jgi:polar amino acid transport system substrate-binding protein